VSEISTGPTTEAASVSTIATVSGSPEQVRRDVPAVVAVVVACNPGPNFESTLLSLAEQDYENLSVLVVDAGSDEPIAERVAEVLPKAYLHRLAGDPGFSVAANQSLELVSGSPFLLFCHDDVWLEPDCVSTLMSELYRNNGGIAGPKLVSWDDSRRLAQLGMGSDRFGVMLDQVERGEFDQDQYDSVRNVFVAPGGVQLVRADLFAALGGFDPTIKVLGEDLDLCWRAQIAGAKVLVVPGAKARHLESMDRNVDHRDRRRLLARHRLRTVLVTAEGRTLFTHVPLSVLLLVLEAFYNMVAGRRGQARDLLAAIPWNLSRLDDIRRRRQLVRRTRSQSDKDVAELQMRGSARMSDLARGQFSAGQDRFSDLVGSVRSSFAGEDAGNVRDATVIFVFVLLLMIFGSRHLLTRGVVPVGQIPNVPGGLDLLREWFGGWRSTGVGGPGNPPTALLLLAGGRLVMFWGSGLFQTLVAIGPIFLAPFAMYRTLRPVASGRAAMVSALLYACTPLIPSAMSAGRWDSMVVLATAPYLIAGLLKLNGDGPYGWDTGVAGRTVVDRSVPVRLIRFAFLVALSAAFVPAVIPVVVVLTLVMAAVSFVLGMGKPLELLLAGALSIVAPVALHGPWSFDVLQAFSWDWLVGPEPPQAGFSSMLELIQFAPGTLEPQLLALSLVAVAALAVLVVRDELFHLVAHGWAIAVTFWLLTWAGRRGWIPFEIPAPETLLALSAAGLSYAVAAGVRSVEIDLIGGGLSARAARLRRATVIVGSVGVAAMFLVGTLAALDGAWRTPQASFATPVDFLVERRFDEADVITEGRVLWIGDDSVLPLDALETDTGIGYIVTDGGYHDVFGRWLAGPVGSTDGVGRQLDLARRGEVVRLGRLMAPYGIDYVVVTQQLAPEPYEGPVVPAEPGVLSSLSQQLDLERVPGVPNLIVFRNRSSFGVAPILPSPDQAQATTAAEQLDIDLTGDSAGYVNEQPGVWTIEAPADASVLVALTDAGLEVSGARTESISGFDDLLVLPPGPDGDVRVEYTPRARRRFAILGQFLIVGVGALLAQTRREVTE
jgi:GT2 family glycosyltransferase